MKKVTVNRSLFLLAVILYSSFLSCTKDEEPQTKTDFLTTKSWIMTSFTVDPALPLSMDENGNYIYSTDLLSFYEDCELDNTWKFNADKTLILDDGSVFCNGINEDPIKGSWTINSAETTLSTTIDGYTQTYSVTELTADIIKLKYTEKDGQTSYTFSISFSH